MAERIDEIGFGGLRLIQEDKSFCYGVDAVLLADYSKASPKDRVLDIGCGNGAASFICRAKYAPGSITGIDIQIDAVELAKRSSLLNGAEGNMDFLCLDVLEAPMHFGKASFTLILCNPPYFEKGGNVVSSLDPLSLARHESSASLKDFFRAASELLVPKGRLCMVHRPSRLGDLMEYPRSFGLEPKRLRMVCPRPGEAANLVLLEYVKGAGKELKVDPELYIRDEEGDYSPDLRKIYGRK